MRAAAPFLIPRAWKLTPLDIAFSPYLAVDSGRPVRDDSFSLAVMKYWRNRLGERGVISNHSVQDPVPDGLKAIYEQLKKVGPPIELQSLTGSDPERQSS